MAETITSLLANARNRLRAADVGDEALDARLLLQRATGLSHVDVIADPGCTISEAAARAFEDMIQRRLAFEPVSRILGEREFYGRLFKVTPDVLDPRPDTETLVDAVLRLLKPGMRVLDLGSGSGAIIVTLLAEHPGVTGFAVDVSAAALVVTIENARRLGVVEQLTAVVGNWFDNLEGTFEVIVSNPPYIPAKDIAGLQPDVSNYDPHLALAGGYDGLGAYRAIAAGAGTHLTPAGPVIVEIGAGQALDVTAIFEAQGFAEAGQWPDLGGHVRVLAFARG